MKFPITKRRPKQLKGLECLNCGQPLSGGENFCSYCGQKNTTRKLSIGHFVSNMFSGFLSYDSRFWTTFIPLLTKPGKVSKDYIDGKRVRFVNPFQLYLNVSIIFFLILGISNKFNTNGSLGDVVKINEKIDSLEQKNISLDSIANLTKDEINKSISNDSTKTKVITDLDEAFKLFKPDSLKQKKEYVYHIHKDSTKKISVFNRIQDFDHSYKNHKDYTVEQALDSLGYKKTFWNKFYYQQIINGYRNIEKLREDKGKSFFKSLMSHVSIALFVFLPIFTLFLWLLYIRKRYTYMEHLVFVFNTQTVFFLLLIIFYLVDFFVKLSNFAWVFILLFLFYLYKALRHFYEQGRAKTIIKFIFLNSFYMFLASFGITIVAMFAMLAG